MNGDSSFVAIVDYDVGNLYSVAQACAHVGMGAVITSDPSVVDAASAVILPGVGAFGDAMARLRELDLLPALRAVPESDRLLIGLCLGQQLLFEGSEEFGAHEGLGVLRGRVRRFPASMVDEDGRRLKVPQVGWNTVHRLDGAAGWDDTLLAGVPDESYLYFVHSYYVVPDDPDDTLAVTTYGSVRYASAVARGNVAGFQCHPERSGERGLQIYENIAGMVIGARLEEAT